MIDLLIFQSLWSTFNASQDLRMGESWLRLKKKYIPQVCYEGLMLFIPKQNKARVVTV